MSIRNFLIDNLKNIPGWRTKRKLVIFSVDDYGNVRVDSKKALENIRKKIPQKAQRFDLFDTLETKEDLEMLYKVLNSVKDRNGNPAVFTPYALSCNIDFEQMQEEGYETYHYELLPDTFQKLSRLQPKAYEGTWELWQEGMAKGFMRPEFHGREHFNLKVFEEKLSKKDPALMVSLENRSLANIGSSGYSSIGWTAAFSFWDPIEDTKRFPEVIQEGLEAFEKVYGYQSKIFTPPAQQFPAHLEGELKSWGLEALDRPFYQGKHLGFGKYKKQFASMGYKKAQDRVELVRNVVFEPTDSAIDHVAKAITQIEAAFRWNKPALISSHRVNFCGHIDPKNREKGLGDLRKLLKAIVQKWPEVEFVSAGELVEIIRNE
ncbi:hypothetical protein [Mongoliitalea daihaiensis]|uniref:hypothetical protein n=1 Tax=Mongoliitalea daihaiensis TaxID=2782006 RepID=UPI001F19DD60|nr:hypothetical protein [Mongoliitalea daihaiensis]UJP64455.1 hypothetical protein IPZ59_16860 [Mongoliitalea daihaiensis]